MFPVQTCRQNAGGEVNDQPGMKREDTASQGEEASTVTQHTKLGTEKHGTTKQRRTEGGFQES